MEQALRVERVIQRVTIELERLKAALAGTRGGAASGQAREVPLPLGPRPLD
jgi:hypothetical protein